MSDDGHALQHGCITHHFVQVIGFRHGFRHPRERREFIDNAAKITNLADDRVGTLFKHVPCRS